MSANMLVHLMLWPPLIGFIINGILGSKLNKTFVQWIGCTGPLVSFIAAVLAYFSFKDQKTVVSFYQWINVPDLFEINFEFFLDNLSFVMLMIVTGVGTLIHAYSGGYMHDDEGFHRFFAYLNLFLFSMLLLILGSNLLILFAGWEGVGLCSFLLIGFWYKNTDYNAAARKAFIMNRIGDLGFLIAMILIAYQFQTLDIRVILDGAKQYPINEPFNVMITLFLFVGVCGKSAQVPLFTWLPDAMAGPTPVSALIHAATMVTAGIYLVARLSAMYTLTPITNQIIIGVGLITALIAAFTALKQNDIKKVLAYSTVSQLGYMVVALGVGAYTTAVFHVVTHAFFKALLFLAAGSVIHGLHGEQDISKMGGLKEKMKWTHLVFLIGTLAIIGCPPFAGFFSKDEILAAAYGHHIIIFILLSIASVCTAWYMLRLYFSCFHGQYRGDHHSWDHAHESPVIMLGPLFVLAILATIGGFFGLPEITHQTHLMHDFLSKSVQDTSHHPSHLFEIVLWLVTIIVLVSLFIITKKRYSNKSIEEYNGSDTGISNVFRNKFYLDEIYDLIIIKPVYSLGNWLKTTFEHQFVQGIMYLPSTVLSKAGTNLRALQSGNTGMYILAMILGLVIFCLMFIFKLV
ncbi:MAG TPA: NADH-quinone oxidoreductase subunit L [Saprospiraceae bacterium]|nr:NADH-quinone oxidoreductase subunit L [Saprospiraceae bacterium]